MFVNRQGPHEVLRYFVRVALLSVANVTQRFGGIVALDDVSFDAEQGEIVGLIGPNGAGKTTAFNVITRLYTPNDGSVRYRLALSAQAWPNVSATVAYVCARDRAVRVLNAATGATIATPKNRSCILFLDAASSTS